MLAGVPAGVPAGALTCWASHYRYSVHETEEARTRAKERADLLDGLRRWTLHDVGRELHLFT